MLRARLIGVGVAIGVATASRFVNGLLGPLCALIVVVQAPPRWRRDTVIWGAWRMPLAAIATLYVVWPRLWAHPIASLAESLQPARRRARAGALARRDHQPPRSAVLRDLPRRDPAARGGGRRARRRGAGDPPAGPQRADRRRVPDHPARRRGVAGPAGRGALRHAVPARARADRRRRVRPARGVGAAPAGVCGAGGRRGRLPRGHAVAHPPVLPRLLRRAGRRRRPRRGARLVRDRVVGRGASTARSRTSTPTRRPARGSTARASSRSISRGSATTCGPR